MSSSATTTSLSSSAVPATGRGGYARVAADTSTNLELEKGESDDPDLQDEDADITSASAALVHSGKQVEGVPTPWCQGWLREFRVIFDLGWVNSVNLLLQFLPGFAMLMFLKTPDDLAGAGMGLMFANISGVSLIEGFCTGLTPLAAQAHGARNPKRVGNLLQRQLLMHMLIVFVPVAATWLAAPSILVAIGQPADIAGLCGTFLLYRFPAMPFYAIRRDLETVLQCVQSPVLPRVLVYAVSAAITVALFWLFLSESAMNLGFIGAPLALSAGDVLTCLVMAWLTPRWMVRLALCTCVRPQLIKIADA